MTTTETQPIGLADIAGISSVEEGRAVALALQNKLQVLKEFYDRVVEIHECSDPEYCCTCDAIREIDPEHGLCNEDDEDDDDDY